VDKLQTKAKIARDYGIQQLGFAFWTKEVFRQAVVSKRRYMGPFYTHLPMVQLGHELGRGYVNVK